MKHIPATEDNPTPQPPHGGSWERLSDGSLRLVEQTDMQPDEQGGDAAPPAAGPAAPTED